MLLTVAGRFHTDEDPPCRTVGTAKAQVSSQGLTHIRRQRQAIRPQTFAAYGQFAGLPIDVIQRHSHHFSGPQAESGQEEQNRIITPAGGGGSVATLQKTLDLLRRE